MIEKCISKAVWAEKGLQPLSLLVTKDKYQLPLAVADSAEELARIIGVRPSTIIKSINERRKSRYMRIYVNMEDDE